MPKKPKRQQNVKNNKFTLLKYKYAMMLFGGVAAIGLTAAYFGIQSLIPVNSNSPVFTPPTNTFMKAVHSPQSGWAFTSQSTSASRSNGMGVGFNSPTILLKFGELDSIHIINEDADTRSLHNFNIDAFNVHTRNLGYFQSQSVTFIADKIGSFVYYCNIHPEMRGLVKVEQ